MKIIRVVLYSIIILFLSAFTTPLLLRFTPSIAANKSPNYLDSFIFILTLIVAVLAFLVGIFVYFNLTDFITYKNKVDCFEEKHKKDVIRITKTIEQQEQYLNQTIGYLFKATYFNVNLIKDRNLAKELLKQLSHDLQIATLYRTSFDINKTPKIDSDKFDVFVYLEENGLTKDIPHLQYVTEHDSNKENRIRAHEIIGRIKERETRDQRSSYLSLNVIHI